MTTSHRILSTLLTISSTLWLLFLTIFFLSQLGKL